MKAVLLAASVCLLLAPEAWSQKKRSDTELAGLVGPVRVIREYRTFSKHRLTPTEMAKLSETTPYRTITYNREGELLEEANQWGLRYTFSHNSEGFRIKTANGDRLPNSGDPIPLYVAERHSETYDASGNLIETVGYLRSERGNPWFRQTFEYDAKGRIYKLSQHWRDTPNTLKLFHIITYTRGANGFEREVTWRNPDGELRDRQSYSSYKHDKRGNWVERFEARYQLYDKNQPKEQWGTIYRIITYY